MWENISGAPFDQDLELAVIDYDGPHALVFPCRRVLGGWTDAKTGWQIDVHPTHWQPWREAAFFADRLLATPILLLPQPIAAPGLAVGSRPFLGPSTRYCGEI
jgi:hypothetical protein